MPPPNPKVKEVPCLAIWTQAREFALCVADIRQQRWVDLATAMRMATASHKDWQQIMRKLGEAL